ncbi:pyridoxal kinase PdxY [Nakamurella flava]|jgi:pyridoxine kinase|uniref:pyridoxal kinase n=1 Tax=Nakamurella flava TaxID=2576308 RepID=A0A4V6CRD4_9ACTN|nr:pyridoxal kinase PdxY [Nakamurella flava]TKV57095.1 pyridoxal kinase PdxY [Nakamurella flava]
MRILSIQSSVAYGHVGNSAAVFPLQRLGHEVWPVSTVQFSNHTGYGAWRGQVFEPAMVAEVIAGIEDRGALGTADALLTGYLGSPGVAEVVLQTLTHLRELNPTVRYCCDPVMGDVGRGMFVLPGLPELIRTTVVPAADVVTPNAYELSFLASGIDPTATPTTDEQIRVHESVRTIEGVLAAVDAVRALGPSTVLVTSVEHAGVADDEIGLIAVDDTGAFEVATPRLPLSVNGAGDVTAAVFLAHLSAGVETALARVASTVFDILDATREAGTREIQLIAAQDQIAHPSARFPVRRIR